MKKLLLFLIIVSLGACAYVDPSLTQQTKIYTDAPLHKSRVYMSAQPRSRQLQPLTAVFLPFYMLEGTEDYKQLGDQLGGIFYENWRGKQMFPIFEFATGRTFHGRAKALSFARSRGADLVVVGFITHMLNGSTLGDTEISIQVKIYETHNGALLFDMAQSGRIEFRGSRDWFVASHEQRMPSSPIFMLIRSMADDMAIPVQSWLPRPGAPLPFANNKEEIVKGMTAELQPATTNGIQSSSQQSRTTSANGERPLTDAMTMEHDLKNQEKGQQGVSLNVLFDVNKDVIRPESYPLLDSLGEALNSPELKNKSVMVAGHTDSDAGAKYNLNLSKRRAEAVKRYLVAKSSIDPARITTVGYGKGNPIAPNDSPKNKQRNRRVEVRILE